MTQIKPAEIDRFLARPDGSKRLILLYGPDEGLIAERAAVLARAVLGEAGDPFAHVRLETGDLADNPGRLSDEAHSISLFGGQRVITLRHSGPRNIAPALQALLDKPPADSFVIVIAGELRKDAPLRRLCETSEGAAAIPCYVDGARDLDRIIDEELAVSGLAMAREARTLLHTLIGSDRLASRSEIRKLCLYATGSEEIGVEDVRAIVGDASAFAVDEAVDALLLGESDAFDRAWRRLISSGTPGFVIAGAVLRQIGFLHRARAEHDSGTPARIIVGRARPPIFFQRQAGVERQIALWPLPRIERALLHLDESIAESRLRGSISDEVIGQALTLIGAVASSLRRSRAA